MDHFEKKDGWILYTLALLLCMVLASLWLLCNIYARYFSQASGDDSARVAAFVFEVNSEAQTGSIPIEQIKKPGDSSVYNITVTNKNASGRISEVAESYTIEASIHGSIPLVCTIKSGTDTVLNVTNTTGTGYASYPKTFASAEEYTDQYQLEVKWPSDKKDAAYASGSGQAEVVITITGVQED